MIFVLPNGYGPVASAPRWILAIGFMPAFKGRCMVKRAIYVFSLPVAVLLAGNLDLDKAIAGPVLVPSHVFAAHGDNMIVPALDLGDGVSLDVAAGAGGGADGGAGGDGAAGGGGPGGGAGGGGAGGGGAGGSGAAGGGGAGGGAEGGGSSGSAEGSGASGAGGGGGVSLGVDLGASVSAGDAGTGAVEAGAPAGAAGNGAGDQSSGTASIDAGAAGAGAGGAAGAGGGAAGNGSGSGLAGDSAGGISAAVGGAPAGDGTGSASGGPAAGASGPSGGGSPAAPESFGDGTYVSQEINDFGGSPATVSDSSAAGSIRSPALAVNLRPAPGGTPPPILVDGCKEPATRGTSGKAQVVWLRTPYAHLGAVEVRDLETGALVEFFPGFPAWVKVVNPATAGRPALADARFLASLRECTAKEILEQTAFNQ